MSASPNYRAINCAALSALPAVLSRILPGGKIVGREYVVLNPTRSDRHLGSFKIRMCGQRAGCWADFATGARGGDAISLVAYTFGFSQSEAARRLATMLSVPLEAANG